MCVCAPSRQSAFYDVSAAAEAIRAEALRSAICAEPAAPTLRDLVRLDAVLSGQMHLPLGDMERLPLPLLTSTQTRKDA